jgi:hypothetical protein
VSDLELRLAVAAAHGLDEEAAGFLVGETVEELDRSARALSQLIGAAGSPEPSAIADVAEQERTAPLADLLADPAGQKKRRQRALLATLHPRRQPRDESGRWTASKPSTGFDGGARALVPTKEPPEVEHSRWLLARLEAARGAAPSGW